jgi:hypothetical protein
MKREPSDAVIERTMKAICKFWAVKLGGDFHPDAAARDCRLTGRIAQRFDEHMQYLWLNASNPYDLANAAVLRANPELNRNFDTSPPYAA